MEAADSQATEVVDLVSDGSSGSEAAPEAGGEGSRVGGVKRGADETPGAEPPAKRSAGGDAELDAGPAPITAPLSGMHLINLSVAPDEEFARLAPSEVAQLVPQLNPPHCSLSLQQLLHPTLQHGVHLEGLEGILATTFVGGSPTALAPYIYGGRPHPPVQDAALSTPVSPPCPFTMVVHSAEQLGRSVPHLQAVPSASAHAFTLLSPPMPASPRWGTSHSKLLFLRWGAGVLHPAGTLRVVAMSSNLFDGDLEQCYQVAWAQDFPVKSAAAGAAASPPHPLQRAFLAPTGLDDMAQQWDGVLSGLGVPDATRAALLGGVDWSGAAAAVVATVAGVHGDPAPWGLPRFAAARAAQRRATVAALAALSGTQAPSLPGTWPSPVWAQVSSVGSMLDTTFNLSRLYLAGNGVADARRAAPGHLPTQPALQGGEVHGAVPGARPGAPRALARAAAGLVPPSNARSAAGDAGRAAWAAAVAAGAPAVSLIWPSAAFMAATRWGGAGNIHLNDNHLDSPKFPSHALRLYQLNPKWAQGPDGPLPRSGDGLAAPLSAHSKLVGPAPTPLPSPWVRFPAGAGDDSWTLRVRLVRDWLYAGSHNASRSAWGSLTRAAEGRGLRLTCNNHEAGVLFPPVYEVEAAPGHALPPCAALSAALPAAPPPFAFVHDTAAPRFADKPGERPYTSWLAAQWAQPAGGAAQ